MITNYKTQAVAELAAEIQKAGFRVFLAASGSHGFYTDADGTRVVSFQYDLGGMKFTGNYKTSAPCSTGTGWELATDSFQGMFDQTAPGWAVRGAEWRHTTLAQHLATYQASSRYTESASLDPVHYGMTQDEARAKAGSNGNFEGPLPLCGNGNFHATVTRDRDHVTCAACVKAL